MTGPPRTSLPGLRPLAELPGWLVAVADPERVGAALARAVPPLPGRAGGSGRCTVRRVRLKDQAWTVRYDVEVPGGVLRLGGALAGPGRPGDDPGADGAGTRWHLPDLGVTVWPEPAERSLPALPRLVDPGAAARLLESSIRSASPAYADARVGACTPRVVRDKPGSRCTILYHVDYRQGAGPAVVVAKTYHGDKGRVAWDGMRSLWGSPLRTGAVAIAIAEPLAFHPDLNVLVQGPVPGERSLKDAVRSALRAGAPGERDELRASLATTAAGLAALHGCGAGAGQVVTLDDEVAEVRGVLARLAAWAPEPARAALPVLARVEALAALHPPDPPGPAHGSFRPAQVLLHDGGVGFIDFDGFCQAEPALDVALFLATLTDIGMRATAGADGASARLAQVQELAGAFLARYRAEAPVSAARVALWQTLDCLTKVLHCWTKVRPSRLADALLVLEHHLAAALPAQAPAG